MAVTTVGESKEIAGKTLKIRLENLDYLGNIELKKETLSEKSILQEERYDFLDEIYYNEDDNDIKLSNISRFIYFKKELKEKVDLQGNDFYLIEEILKEKIKLFEVQGYDFSGNNIILHTTDNISYIGDFEKYLKNGLEALDFYDGDLKENNLGDFYISVNNKVISIKKNGEEVNTIVGNAFEILNEEKKELYIVDDNRLEKIKLSDDGKSYEELGVMSDLSSLGNIKQIKFDNNKNFLGVIAEKEGKTTLHILNSTGQEELYSIENIKKILFFNEVKNDIYCIDKDEKIRYITTNFNNFEKDYSGKIAKESEIAKQKAFEVLQKGIQINGGTDNKENTKNADLIEKIYDTEITLGDGNKQKFRDILENAKSKEDFKIIEAIISNLKSEEVFSKIPGLFDNIEIDIKNKQDKVLLEEIYSKIDKIEKDLNDENIDISVLVLYKKELKDILEKRGSINIPTNDKDKKIGVLIKQIEDKIKNLKETASEDILESINENIEVLKGVLENIIFLEHLNSVYETDEYKKVLELSEFLSSDKKIEVKKELKKLIQDKQNALQTEKTKNEILAQKQLEEKIQEIKRDFVEIKNLVDLQNNERSILKIKAENGLVQNIIDKIFELPVTESDKLYQELENIFNSKISSLRFGKNAFKTEGTLIDFGDGVKVAKFVPEVEKKVKWEIKAKRNNGEIVIYFENNLGGKIEPELDKLYRLENPLAVSKEDFAVLQDYVKKWNSKYKKEFYDKLSEFKKLEKQYLEDIENKDLKKEYEKAKEEYEDIKSKAYLARIFYKLPKYNIVSRKIPEIQPNTIIGPTTKKFLKDFAALADIQVKSKGAGSGIIIIESDAGTGKNFKIDLYAHFTNREVFEMQGNKTAQKEDILYSYELGPDGTYRLPSHLIKGITTPGSIIVFDEINTYPAEVLKLLNPLLDGRRYINDPQMGKVKVADDVVIVGLMNPSNYLGTSKLAQEIKSRARFMIDTYPAEFDENQNPSSEEAYLISRHFKGDIGKMDEETFEGIWQKVVVNGKKYKDEKISKIFNDLKKYISLTNELREQYRKTQKDEADEEFNFIVSLREGIQVIEEYDINGGNMKQAIIDVIKPKIEENEEKEFFEQKVNSYF